MTTRRDYLKSVAVASRLLGNGPSVDRPLGAAVLPLSLFVSEAYRDDLDAPLDDAFMADAHKIVGVEIAVTDLERRDLACVKVPTDIPNGVLHLEFDVDQTGTAEWVTFRNALTKEPIVELEARACLNFQALSIGDLFRFPIYIEAAA